MQLVSVFHRSRRRALVHRAGLFLLRDVTARRVLLREHALEEPAGVRGTETEDGERAHAGGALVRVTVQEPWTTYAPSRMM